MQSICGQCQSKKLLDVINGTKSLKCRGLRRPASWSGGRNNSPGNAPTGTPLPDDHPSWFIRHNRGSSAVLSQLVLLLLCCACRRLLLGFSLAIWLALESFHNHAWPVDADGQRQSTLDRHQGRVRCFPHQEGNYATHVYISGTLHEIRKLWCGTHH